MQKSYVMENFSTIISKFNAEYLRKLLLEANVAYRIGKPVMTDEEFDKIEEELRKIFETFNSGETTNYPLQIELADIQYNE